jgi:hypothetical protein
MSNATPIDMVQLALNQLTNETKESFKEVKRVAVSQAWKVLQLAVAIVIQTIEQTGSTLKGSDKKIIAMDSISNFYDKVFLVVDVPFVPNLLEPAMHKYIKSFLMILVGSTIDAMVATFRDIGIFQTKPVVMESQNLNSTTKRKRKSK